MAKRRIENNRNKCSSISEANSKKAGCIMLVVDRQGFLNTIFWVKIIDMIENELNRRGIQCLFKIVDDCDGKILMPEIQPDGYIILGLVSAETIHDMTATGFPVVLVDSRFLDLKLDHVRANNHQGSFMMTELIIEKGHRRILFVGDTGFSASFAERCNGVRDCAAAHADMNIRVDCVTSGGTGRQQPFNKDEVAEILTRDDRPTAVFCANDSIAVEVYELLKQLNLAIPDDISVVGFDNIRDAKLLKPGLTTVDVPKIDIALAAVETLLNKLANPGRRNSLIMLQTEIIERESLAKISES